LDTALQVLQRGINRPLKQRATAWLSTTWLARQALSPMLVKQVARKARKAHYPAPFALIETWRRNGGSVESRLLAEAKSVAKLAQTPTARNLVREFFLQERLKNLGSKDGQGTPLPNLQRVHVIGAGVMGGDRRGSHGRRHRGMVCLAWLRDQSAGSVAGTGPACH